jgi:hypothetical protein
MCIVCLSDLLLFETMSSRKGRGRIWCCYTSAAKATGYRNFTATFQFDNTDGTAADMANVALGGIPSITFAAVCTRNCKPFTKPVSDTVALA